jgi:hypothetical protein
METFRAERERVAGRMMLLGAAGVVGGAVRAMYSGGSPVMRATFMAGTSCCMVGTAIFGAESLAYLALQRIHQATGTKEAHGRDLLISHGVGGLCGGALVGGLFQHRVMPGMILFTPLMLGVAVAEIKFLEMRGARIKELQLDGMNTQSNRRRNDDSYSR